MLKNRRGQNTFEFVVVVVVVIAAVIAMAIFMKRAVMGKFRESADQTGGQFTPLGTTNDYTRTFVGTRTDQLQFTGQSDSTGINETQDRTGTEQVAVQAGEILF
jgi:hypothetical protein